MLAFINKELETTSKEYIEKVWSLNYLPAFGWWFKDSWSLVQWSHSGQAFLFNSKSRIPTFPEILYILWSFCYYHLQEMHCYSQLVSCSSCFKNKNIHSEIRQQSNQSSLQYLPQNSRVGNTLNLEFIYRCGFSTHNAFNSKCMDSIKGLQATYEESEHINLTSLYEAFIQEDMVRIQRKLIKSLIFHWRRSIYKSRVIQKDKNTPICSAFND